MIQSRRGSYPRLCPWYCNPPSKAIHDTHPSPQCLSMRIGFISPFYISSRRTLYSYPICLFNSPRTNYRPANWGNPCTVVAQFQALLITEKLFPSFAVINMVFLKHNNRGIHFLYALEELHLGALPKATSLNFT